MAIERILLDPAAEVNPTSTDELTEGATNKYDTGAPPADTDALPEGTSNKYDTGVPPANTDALSEGATNKYDTGVPPSDLDGLPDGATRLAMVDAEKTKLTGIEVGAKDDQSGAEIKTAYEGEANTYNDTKDTKLDGIAAGAEVNPADLAALDSTAATKLSGIDEGAKDDQTGPEVRDLIVAIADLDRKIVVTDPATGEYKVIAVQVDADQKVAVDKNSVPEV